METASALLPAGIDGRTLPAFGTSVAFWVTDAAWLDGVEAVLADWLATVDRACSRFRDDSDLARVNGRAGSPVEASEVLIDAVEAALEMARLTDGLYDPTVGRALIAAGYDQSFDQLPTKRDAPAGRPRPAGRWREVAVDRAESTIRVPLGVSLDLGGSAKGWSVDVGLALCGLSLGSEPVGVCISAGGDLGVTGPAPAGGWPIRVAEMLDSQPSADDGWLRLDDGAVATSGALRRRWSMGDGDAHHIIDPRTGAPGSSCWRLVTVMAGSCLLADTAATAAWLLDRDAPAWLKAHGLQARLVHNDGSVVTVGLTAGDRS